MAIYIFISISCLISYVLSNNDKNSLSPRFLLIILTLFTGLSYTNGWDWYGYLDFYNNIQNEGVSAIYEYNIYGIEYLYLIYLYIVGLSGGSFSLFILLNAIIINFLIYSFCKRAYVNYSLFMFIFIAASYLRLELSTIRQGLAVVIVIYSYSLLLNSKINLSLLFIFLAICFHRSAAIVLLSFPFVYYNSARNIHYFIVILTIPFVILSGELNVVFIKILNAFNSSLLNAYISKLIIYLSLNKQAIINPQAMALLVFYFICIRVCDVKNKKQIIFLNIIACQVIISFYFIFLTQLIIMRLVYYFQVGWICWVIILYKEYFRPKWLCFFLICLLFITKSILNFRYEQDRAVFFPYYNVISSYLDDNYGRSRSFILNKADELFKE
ncbi:TPA: O84 family O-antigen polymerase [Escherichia coli]